MNPTRALYLTKCIPRPPRQWGLCKTISSGFARVSWYCQDLQDFTMLETSQTHRSTHLVLNFESAKLFIVQLLLVIGTNIPPFHNLILLSTRFWSSSPLAFLVLAQMALRITPTMSKWSAKSCTCTVEYSSIYLALRICI